MASHGRQELPSAAVLPSEITSVTRWVVFLWQIVTGRQRPQAGRHFGLFAANVDDLDHVAAGSQEAEYGRHDGDQWQDGLNQLASLVEMDLRDAMECAREVEQHGGEADPEHEHADLAPECFAIAAKADEIAPALPRPPAEARPIAGGGPPETLLTQNRN